jgi:hypothetical protein
MIENKSNKLNLLTKYWLISIGVTMVLSGTLSGSLYLSDKIDLTSPQKNQSLINYLPEYNQQMENKRNLAIGLIGIGSICIVTDTILFKRRNTE